MQTTKYKTLNGVRAFRRWAIPYFNSRIHANQFRPVLCYLFTEWRCNIDCHDCFQYDNQTDQRLPKALLNIEPQFRYLVERQKQHGYVVFFNINICRSNLKDVRLLTEIAHQNGIGTDYHLNDPPHSFVDTPHYRHQDDMLSITDKEWDEVDRLLDWLVEKQRQGWPMVNSIPHLRNFKLCMRGRLQPWDCRGGHNGALIRTDGTLSPCFDLITYDEDWGRIWEPKFDEDRLRSIKRRCLRNCSSTCYHTMANYYNMRSLPDWIAKHIRIG